MLSRLLSRALFPPLSPNLDSGETIARFLFLTDHYNASSGAIKSRAFQPRSDSLTLSVFRIAGLSRRLIWLLGDLFSAGSRVSPAARADIAVSAVSHLGLHVVPDAPPPRHAQIAGWPAEKSERLSFAQRLAKSAILELSPERNHHS